MIVSIIDEGSSIKANLKLSLQKGSVFFEYSDETNHSIIRESINQFRSIQLSQDDPMKIILHGNLVDRHLLFESENDYSYFLRFIQDHAALIPNENDLRTFVIKVGHPVQQPGLSDFVNSLIKNPNEQSRVKRNVDGLSFNHIESFLPSTKLNVLTKDEAKDVDLSKDSLSTFQVQENAYPILITRLINPPDITHEYQRLKKQWKLTSSEEWQHFLQMRCFVNSVEKYIEKSQLSTEYHKQLFFNMSITLFTRYFAKLSFSNELILIINLLFQCFLTEYADDNGFLTTLNESISFEKAELLIFSHLCEIWEKMQKDSQSVQKESTEVRNLLEKISPSTLAMLDDRKLSLLDFVMADTNLLFTRGRKPDESMMLFVSALSSASISLFKKNMICTSLILLQEKLQLISINDMKTFKETYQTELRFINPRLLVLNNFILCKSINHE